MEKKVFTACSLLLACPALACPEFIEGSKSRGANSCRLCIALYAMPQTFRSEKKRQGREGPCLQTFLGTLLIYGHSLLLYTKLNDSKTSFRNPPQADIRGSTGSPP